GSLGIDLATAVNVTLIDQNPVRIPTTTRGPLHTSRQRMGALLLGRPSSGLRGIIIFPGVIDADYTGTVEIVASTLFPPLIIPKGSRITQLVPLENLAARICPPTPSTPVRGEAGFGSMGPVACLTLRMQKRPTLPVTLIHQGERVTTEALLNTGADVTLVS
ncbi:hypothetical protein N309_02597, partial [Tinamus guttatus]